MARLFRIGGSFVTVLVAYWAYTLLAVPLIEPPAERYQSDHNSDEESFTLGRGANGPWPKALQGLFPPGSWELENPIKLESDRVKLLLQEYRRLGDGKRVKIDPCTIIFTPDGPPSDAEQRRRASVILEAPDGALLEFDQPFDLHRAKIGRLVGGQLNGRITIRSEGRSPGPEDNLMLVTRDVALSEQQISTPHTVDFCLGPNYGRGHGLTIQLLPDENKENKKHGPNIGGIQFFEIRRLEGLHLLLDDEGLGPAAQTGAAPSSGPAKSDAESKLPVEITCRGPFRFDLVEQLATFQDQVDVLRVHPNGPSDQLNCERLSIYFARPRRSRPAGQKDDSPGTETGRSHTWDLRPRRIEAQGNPVVLRSPSQQIHMRGEHLEYDLQAGRIVLDGSQAVFLKRGADEIHARKLEYTSLGRGRLGNMLAVGPGWLRGQMGDKPGQQLQARWQQRLQVSRDAGQPLISLTGGAELKFGPIGRLTASEIYFWLLELPPAPNSEQPQTQADRMLAQHQVEIYSPQLAGTVADQFKVWFEQAPTGSQNPAEDQGTARSVPPPSAGAPGAIGPRAVVPSGKATSLLSAALLPPRFEIFGKELRCRVLLGGEKPQLAELTVEGDVRLTETRTGQPGERPGLVSGQFVHVVDANQPQATVTVTGKPAHFQGRGLGLTGSNIHLDRGVGELRIDGPGRMDLPLDRDLEGRPLDKPGRLQIDWQQGMLFDGRTARFQGSVVAAARHPDLRTDIETETMEVTLLRPIRFADPDDQPPPKVDRIVCRGSVLMENHSYQERTLVSVDRMQVSDLDVNLTSGQTSAKGPGWMTSIRRGRPELLAPRTENNKPDDQAAPAKSDDQPGPAKSDDDRLRYLNVGFRGSLVGNVLNREMTFRDQVRAIYGPVDSWQATLDPDNPDALRPRDVLLDCDQLTVAEMPVPAENRRAMEFEALGNVVVELRAFTARAPRMTYTEAKDLLILEGNGLTDAELYYQKHIGGPVSKKSAHKIFYWRSTGQAQFGGPRSLVLELNPPSED